MKILVVSATAFELAPFREWLEESFTASSPVGFKKEELEIDLLVSGVGLPVTAFSLGTVLARKQYDLAIQAGIAGAFDKELELGQVVEVTADRFADVGAEDKDGSFLDLNALGLQEKESGVFNANGQILNTSAIDNRTGLPSVSALSVNRASGSAATIAALQKLYPEASIETMEGAAFFYACRTNKVAMLALRSISNYVTPRDRNAWNVPLALDKLNQTLIALIAAFDKEAASASNR